MKCPKDSSNTEKARTFQNATQLHNTSEPCDLQADNMEWMKDGSISVKAGEKNAKGQSKGLKCCRTPLDPLL